MRYLCIDTSNGASVSIVEFDGKNLKILSDKQMDNPRMHGEKLAVLLSDVLNEIGVENISQAGIDRVVCGTGPAPFTGLRAGLVTARVVAFSGGVPLLGICSLDVLALQGLDFASKNNPSCLEEENNSAIFVATDARRKEVYYGLYTANGKDDVKSISEVNVQTPEQVVSKIQEYADLNVINVGQGCKKYSEYFAIDENAPLDVQSYNLARIAYSRENIGIDISSTEPMYLRRPDVQEPTK